MNCLHSVFRRRFPIFGAALGMMTMAMALWAIPDASAQEQRPRPGVNDKRVRTIKDFPRLEKPGPAAPPADKRVRTAEDFEKPSVGRDGETETGGEENPVQIDLRDPNKEQRAAAEVEVLQHYAFNVSGPDLLRAAGEAGYRFGPKGGKPAADGSGMAAFQMAVNPQTMTSLVRGHQMIQFQPSEFWVIQSISNQFHMFMDDKGAPKPLNEGWTVSDVALKGKDWRWLSQPKNGARSLFFSVELTARHGADTIVEIAGARLLGPPGVKDWREAFRPQKKAADSQGPRRPKVGASGI